MCAPCCPGGGSPHTACSPPLPASVSPACARLPWRSLKLLTASVVTWAAAAALVELKPSQTRQVEGPSSWAATGDRRSASPRSPSSVSPMRWALPSCRPLGCVVATSTRCVPEGAPPPPPPGCTLSAASVSVESRGRPSVSSMSARLGCTHAVRGAPATSEPAPPLSRCLVLWLCGLCPPLVAVSPVLLDFTHGRHCAAPTSEPGLLVLSLVAALGCTHARR